MRIVIASDHLMFADALGNALAVHGIAVLSRCGTAQELLGAVARYEPDICLLGPGFSEAGTLDVLRKIGMRHPAIKVVLFSDSSDPATISAAVEAGAAGFITKDQHMPDVIGTLVRVRDGEHAFGEDQAEPRPRRPGPFGPAHYPPRMLTFRELQVLRLMTEGESTKQIARSLAISLSTARTHVQSALVKLGAHSRLEASSIVARYGLPGAIGQLAGTLSARAAAGG
jgi:two-component system, NarL family, nitrate/nitrite response regulator NarL